MTNSQDFFSPRAQFRRVLASGIPRRRSWLAAVLKMSLVFAPLARQMGMQRGPLERCPACRAPRFVWQTCCPHCQRWEAVGPEREEEEPALKQPFWEKTVSEEENAAEALYRMIIPGLLIVSAWTILKTR